MHIPDHLLQCVQSFTQAMQLRGYSPATLASYGASLRAFMAYLGTAGIQDIREVTSTTIRNYHLHLLKQNYRPWTILTRVQAVRRLFEHLEATHSVLLNPCNGEHTQKIPRQLPRTVLTLEEVRAILEVPNTRTSAGVRDKALLEVFYSCGIRLEEMTQLTLADVDVRNGFLRVNHGKFAKDRVVPLGQNACEALRCYIEHVRPQWNSGAQKRLWLGSVHPHRPLTSQTIEVTIRQYGRRAGVAKRVTPHVWRHTCATHLVSSGANLAYVQRLLGHASLRTTQLYVQISIPEIKAMHTQAHPRNQEKNRCKS